MQSLRRHKPSAADAAGVQTVLVTGYAKAPRGTSMYEIYKHSGVVLEIDPRTDEIVDAEFTLVTDLAKDFLRRLVCGQRLTRDLCHLTQRLKRHYLAPSQDAALVALRVAAQRYFDSKADGTVAG